jgi:hypothetical protein
MHGAVMNKTKKSDFYPRAARKHPFEDGYEVEDQDEEGAEDEELLEVRIIIYPLCFPMVYFATRTENGRKSDINLAFIQRRRLLKRPSFLRRPLRPPPGTASQSGRRARANLLGSEVCYRCSGTESTKVGNSSYLRYVRTFFSV